MTNSNKIGHIQIHAFDECKIHCVRRTVCVSVVWELWSILLSFLIFCIYIQKLYLLRRPTHALKIWMWCFQHNFNAINFILFFFFDGMCKTTCIVYTQYKRNEYRINVFVNFTAPNQLTNYYTKSYGVIKIQFWCTEDNTFRFWEWKEYINLFKLQQSAHG